MAATTPKSPVPSAITGQIGVFDASKLKHATTEEKNPLPTKEALAQEKQEEKLRDSIEGFHGSELKHVKTVEGTSAAVTYSQEKTMQNIEGFDASKLKHAETKEKNPLPDTAVVEAEKQHQNFVSGIEHFHKEELKHTDPQVKTVMPDPAVINQEKTLQHIEGFDKMKLKHAETNEKNPLPDKAAIEEEKRLSKGSS